MAIMKISRNCFGLFMLTSLAGCAAGIWFFQGSLSPCDILKRQTMRYANEAVTKSDLDGLASEMALGALKYKITQITGDLMSPAECTKTLIFGWPGERKEKEKPAVAIKQGVSIDAEVLFDGKDPGPAKENPKPLGKSIDADVLFGD